MMDEIRLFFDTVHKMTPVRIMQGQVLRQVLRPMLLVRLSYDQTALELYAMVDTGADFSTFHRGIATSLGIPDARMIPVKIRTLSQGVGAWFCPIGIDFQGKNFVCPAYFVDNPEWPPVIGRDVIFSRLKFAFRQSVGEFYISFSP